MSVGRSGILQWALGWKHTAAVSPVADSQTISSSVRQTAVGVYQVVLSEIVR